MVAGKMASKMLIYFIENKITVKKERTHYLSEPCGARDHSAYPHSLCFSSCLRLPALVSLDDWTIPGNSNKSSPFHVAFGQHFTTARETK